MGDSTAHACKHQRKGCPRFPGRAICPATLSSHPHPGGLDDALSALLRLAAEGEVPVIFCLKRRALSAAFGKRANVSVVSILNADGANQLLAQSVQRANELREDYRRGTRATTKLGA